MAHETTIALRLLFSLLGGDGGEPEASEPIAPLGDSLRGIYRDVAPQGAPLPYAILVSQGSTDTDTAGARVLSEVTYLIKIVSVDASQDEAAEAAAGRIDTLLQDYKGTQDGHLVRIKRQGAFPEFTEPVAGKGIYRHQGAYWRLKISKIHIETEEEA